MIENQTHDAERLWTQFAAELRSYLRSRLPNDMAADDLLQETFLRIHRKQAELQDVRSAKAWVYQIARNLIVDFYRSADKRQVEGIEPWADKLDERHLSILDVRDQIARWLETAIEELPETYREATRLSALAGLPHQKIADQLGLSLEAAKSRVRRGREQLKASLNACCSFEKDSRGALLDYEPNGKGDCCSGGDSTA